MTLSAKERRSDSIPQTRAVQHETVYGEQGVCCEIVVSLQIHDTQRRSAKERRPDSIPQTCAFLARSRRLWGARLHTPPGLKVSFAHSAMKVEGGKIWQV